MTEARVPLAAPAFAGALFALALAGCSTSDTSPPEASGFPGYIDRVIAEAIAADADANQLAILEDAAQAGTVTYAANEEALNATFDCFEAAGITYERGADAEVSGFQTPSYSYFISTTAPDSETLPAVADSCITKYSDFVSRLYQTQPEAADARDRALEAATPALIACLVENGVETDDGAPTDELVTLAMQLHEGTDPTVGGPDCMREAGLVN